VTPMRARYAIAALLAGAWIFLFSLVSHGWSSLLQLGGICVGGIIFGAIAWPDDFRRTPPTRHDEPHA
jgi:hypothetical protein